MWSDDNSKDFAVKFESIFKYMDFQDIRKELQYEPYFMDKMRCLDNEDGDERWQAENDLNDELDISVDSIMELKCRPSLW